MAPPRSTCQTSPARRRPALSRALFSLPGGYDGNDVQFSWLRGNDSVRGLENLRLAQYTIQRYFTSVTRSQQETGNSGDELGESYRTSCIPSSALCFIPLGPGTRLQSGGAMGRGLGPLTCSTPSTVAGPKGLTV